MNTPLIEYTFEFLALAGVQEVYVFCCAHADQVRDYIANSKWNTSASPFKVYTIVSRESLSVGDALRELDAKQLITSDFILVSGDVVSNVPLADVLAKHRARREVDKNSIMTMVVREASPYHRTRAQSESSVFVIDKKTQQCVHYEANEQGKKAISLDPQILSEHEELEIRNDLIDCQIDICSNDVPALFTENFDYQDIRKDFVYGVLTSDLLGKKIHCYVAKDHYAARVRSLQTYDAISKDVIARWTYPLVPDSNLLGQTFSYQRSQIYKEENVVLARSCVVRSKCLIGAYTTIGDATVVSDTVIGRNCTIGSNCKLEDTFLWENVSVGDNCTIQKAIIADGVTIGNNCTIEEGAVIASGVVVGNNVVIPGDMRLTIHESHSQGIPDDPELVGEGGHGLEYCAEEDSDEEELMEASGLVQKFSAVDIESSSDSDYSSSSEDDMDFPNAFSARRDSVTTMNSEDFDEGDFNKEAQQSLERAFEENHEVDIAVLELNTLRMAMNANYHEVRSAIVMALLKYMIALGSPIRDAVNKVMSRWSPLLARLTFNQDDQVDVMLSLQRYCVRFNASRYFPLILTYFYNEEVVDEDGFHQWYDDPRASAGENASLYNGSGQQFMEWLDTAESESSSEEEEEA